MRIRCAAPHIGQDQRQRAGILSAVRMQIRESQHVGDQGGRRDGDLGNLIAGRLHALPDTARAAVEQTRQRQLPGAHERRCK